MTDKKYEELKENSLNLIAEFRSGKYDTSERLEKILTQMENLTTSVAKGHLKTKQFQEVDSYLNLAERWTKYKLQLRWTKIK